MTLPPPLQAAIESELTGINHLALTSAVEGLSQRYREPKNQVRQYISAEVDRRAYIACRMPATFAVVCRVFEEIRQLMPEMTPKSLLDLGSGPGTALWAANAILPSLERLQAIEMDSQLIAIGKRLTTFATDERLQQATWKQQDLSQWGNSVEITGADIVVASYALGELAPEAQMKSLSIAWQSAKEALVLIEPGTPPGFKRILAWRSWLLESKATLLAPCPHALACPMAGNDWCHFSQRLSRSSLHRQLKSAELGHEDEKYSYLIAIKQPRPYGQEGRILRHPQKHSGHLELTLCTAEGTIKKTLSRRDGDLYKKARKLDWGDLIRLLNIQ